MKLEYFIAHRFASGDKDAKQSRPAVAIATAGIAIGLAVMIIALAVIIGFKREVSGQVVGFGSHIQILPEHTNIDTQPQPLSLTAATERALTDIDNVRSVEHIVQRTGIIHTAEAFQGVVLKGIDSTYDWRFFSKNIVAGTTLEHDTMPQSAIISQAIADAMDLDTADRFNVYFVDNALRARRFRVAGIYQTTFADYDKLYIITHLTTLQRLNKWQKEEYSHYEVLVDHFDRCDETASQVFSTIITDPRYRNSRVETIENLTPQIFDWLDMLDANAIVIICLMIAVAGFCIISGLLILILERQNTIGLLKALGAKDRSIRLVFMTQASILIAKGMLWGNIIGLAIVAIQYFTHLIPLDPASYYVNFVPVYLPLYYWLITNVTIAAISVLVMIAPSHVITKISPSEAMRHE